MPPNKPSPTSTPADQEWFRSALPDAVASLDPAIYVDIHPAPISPDYSMGKLCFHQPARRRKRLAHGHLDSGLRRRTAPARPYRQFANWGRLHFLDAEKLDPMTAQRLAEQVFHWNGKAGNPVLIVGDKHCQLQELRGIELECLQFGFLLIHSVPHTGHAQLGDTTEATTFRPTISTWQSAGLKRRPILAITPSTTAASSHVNRGVAGHRARGG